MLIFADTTEECEQIFRLECLTEKYVACVGANQDEIDKLKLFCEELNTHSIINSKKVFCFSEKEATENIRGYRAHTVILLKSDKMDNEFVQHVCLGYMASKPWKRPVG